MSETIQEVSHPTILQAREHYAAGLFPQAREAYLEALKAVPSDPDLRHEFAMVLFHLGQLEEASQQLRRVLDGKEDARTWNDLGVVQIELGKPAEAAVSFLKSLQRAPGVSGVVCNLSTSLIDSGKKAEGLKLLHQVLRTHPEEVRAHYLLGLEENANPTGLEHHALSIGDILTVTRRTDFVRASDPVQWKVRLEEMTERTLSTSLPSSRGLYVPLRTSSRVIVGHPSVEALWGIVVDVQGIRRDNIPLLLLSKPSSFRRIQQRRHVRIPSEGILRSVARLEASGTDPVRMEIAIGKFREHDISALGVGMVVFEDVPHGTPLKIDLLFGQVLVKLNGRVVRRSQIGDGSWFLGVAFQELDERTEEKLAGQIHQLQLERRRKSLA